MFNIDEIYSVSDFLALCKKNIEDNIPTCWLRGEISNLSRPASGHWYFSIKDNRGQINCALFRLNQRHIKFDLEHGMEVIIRAAPSLYEARGDFQLIVEHIEPVGVGNLQLAFEQLKEKLAKEGLFDTQNKKPLPKKPSVIGVVSSSTGSVIQDIIKVLKNRYPFTQIRLYDSLVQGESASQNLIRALNSADQNKQCDVIILARGGGSLEDLWAFNEEPLAREIFHANTPIISAVGHETDTTIADFVSDARAPTPSAAAMMATPDRQELLAKSEQLHSRLIKASRQHINLYQHQLQRYHLTSPAQQIYTLFQQIDGLFAQLSHKIHLLVHQKNTTLNSWVERLKKQSPITRIQNKKQATAVAKLRLLQSTNNTLNQHQNQLVFLVERLHRSVRHDLEKHNNSLRSYANALDHLSPLKTLSRGYSLTTDTHNKLILSVCDIKIGTKITTTLTDGTIDSTIDKIDKN